jgi:hypothetical protein
MFQSGEAEVGVDEFQWEGSGVSTLHHAVEGVASAYQQLCKILRQVFARTPARCGLQDGRYGILKRAAGKAASNDARAVICHGYKPCSHSS